MKDEGAKLQKEIRGELSREGARNWKWPVSAKVQSLAKQTMERAEEQGPAVRGGGAQKLIGPLLNRKSLLVREVFHSPRRAPSDMKEKPTQSGDVPEEEPSVQKYLLANRVLTARAAYRGTYPGRDRKW